MSNHFELDLNLDVSATDAEFQRVAREQGWTLVPVSPRRWRLHMSAPTDKGKDACEVHALREIVRVARDNRWVVTVDNA